MPPGFHCQRSSGAVSVVVCSPDESRLDEICNWLVSHRFSPLPVANPAGAARLSRYAQPEVLILDLAHGNAALDLLRARQEPGFPYVSVLALASADFDSPELDRVAPPLWVEGLLSYPLDFDDLLHRIVEVLRDIHHRDDLVLRVGLLVVDPPRRKVTVGDEEIHLTPKEFALLQVFASDPLRVFSKAELTDEVWGRNFSDRSRSVESHASRLRKKLDLPVPLGRTDLVEDADGPRVLRVVEVGNRVALTLHQVSRISGGYQGFVRYLRTAVPAHEFSISLGRAAGWSHTAGRI